MTTTLTATVQSQYARVRLDLTFTTATSATISRVHADGTVWPLRDANPTPVLSTTGIGAVIFDHEAPLDQTIYYTATSGGASVSSSTLTLASDPGWVGSNVWLTHPLKPSLSMLLTVTDIGAQTRAARNGILQILGSPLSVSISDTRVIGPSSLTALTTTVADTLSLRALLADGATLLLRPPAAWSTPWQYVTFGDVTEVGATSVGPIADREWVMPYTVAAPTAGGSLGAVGSTYADAKAAYSTYALLKAGEATYSALKQKAGP